MAKHQIIRHYIKIPDITQNSSEFDIIEIEYKGAYKYVTTNGETKKYLR